MPVHWCIVSTYDTPCPFLRAAGHGETLTNRCDLALTYTVWPPHGCVTRSTIRYVARIGYRIYREYQAALSPGVDDAQNEGAEEFFPIEQAVPQLIPTHHVGLLNVDVRAKVFSQPHFPYGDPDDPRKPPIELPLLGRPQWDRIEAALAEGGALDKVHTLLLATPIPPFWMGTGHSKVMAMKVNDIEGHWCMPRNQVRPGG